MSWSFTQANGTTCIGEQFLGMTRISCTPSWFFWVTLALVLSLLIYNLANIYLEWRNDR